MATTGGSTSGTYEWRPEGGALASATKPEYISRTISYVFVPSTDGDGSSGSGSSSGGGGSGSGSSAMSIVLRVVSHDLADNIVIVEDGNTVTITGTTEALFPPPAGIKYVINTDKYVTDRINRVPYEADPYDYRADGTQVRTHTIVVGAYSGDRQVSMQTFSLPIYNSWNAHASSLVALMTNNYEYTPE